MSITSLFAFGNNYHLTIDQNGAFVWGNKLDTIKGVLDYSTTIVSTKADLDNRVFTVGKKFTVLMQSKFPDLDTGEHEVEDFGTAKLIRKMTVDNNMGKTRLFLTTFRAMGRRKPVKDMRFVRNSIVHEVIKITGQGNNAFLIECETV